MTNRDIGVKGGGLDDALHMVNPIEPTRTLCDQIAATRNLVDTYEELRAEHNGQGCWTCEDAYSTAAYLPKTPPTEPLSGPRWWKETHPERNR